MFSFFAGGGAVKFVKDYAAAGLNKTIPLYGAGFLTDGTIEAQSEVGLGTKFTIHLPTAVVSPQFSVASEKGADSELTTDN